MSEKFRRPMVSSPTSVWTVGGLSDPAVPNGETGLIMLYGPQP
jgi:hypothetical protein